MQFKSIYFSDVKKKEKKDLHFRSSLDGTLCDIS